MSLLTDLQNILSQKQSNNSQASGSGLSSLSNLSSLLGPAALGGIAGALLTSGKGRKLAGNALLIGGSAFLAHTLWNKYKNRMPQTPSAQLAAQPQALAQASPATDQAQAKRYVRALVFAAKSDGHIDPKEAEAIKKSLHEMNIGADMEALIEQAIQEPLDPYLIAQGVSNSEEALQLYILSRSAIDVDHFMERAYLDALGKALGIPDDMVREIDLELGKQT